MFKRSKILMLGALPVAISLYGCGKSKSQYDSGAQSTPPAAPTGQPQIPTTQAPDAAICAANQKAIGSNILFMVDNSSSLSSTDCPSPVRGNRIQDGNSGTIDSWQCNGSTNREQAVLAAYDLLSNVSTRDPSPSAVSNISVIGFPAPGNATQNVIFATNGGISSLQPATNRAALQTSLQFTRQPAGATVFGAPIANAASFFQQPASDARSRIAVLITDGEPADRNPADTTSRAQQLRQQGVDVVTIYVTNSQTRAAREQAHQSMLQGWEQRSQPNHYYATQYQSFDAYIAEILGRNGKVSLTDAVTSQVVATCVDSPSAPCQRWRVEVQDTAGLAYAVKQVIRLKAIRCI